MTIQQCKYIVKIAECGSLNEADAEFVQYARQLAEQNDFIMSRYAQDSECRHLYISTQHYDFVADIFGRLLNAASDERYRFSLREMKTYDVIHQIETAFCDVGIIAIKGKDHGIMERYINKKGLTFTPLVKAMPHVYVRKEHPIAQRALITEEQLRAYPYVSYEQGEHSSPFFTEEIITAYSDKRVEISDRASLMNVLLTTDCYTIGYLLRGGRNISDLTKTFVEMLNAAANGFR